MCFVFCLVYVFLFVKDYWRHCSQNEVFLHCLMNTSYSVISLRVSLIPSLYPVTVRPFSRLEYNTWIDYVSLSLIQLYPLALFQWYIILCGWIMSLSIPHNLSHLSTCRLQNAGGWCLSLSHTAFRTFPREEYSTGRVYALPPDTLHVVTAHTDLMIHQP